MDFKVPVSPLHLMWHICAHKRTKQTSVDLVGHLKAWITALYSSIPHPTTKKLMKLPLLSVVGYILGSNSSPIHPLLIDV